MSRKRKARSRLRNAPAHLSRDDEERLWDHVDQILGHALEAQILLASKPTHGIRKEKRSAQVVKEVATP